MAHQVDGKRIGVRCFLDRNHESQILQMGLVICVPKPEASKTSDVHDAISCICKDVIPKKDEVLFVPRPGRLMDVLKILKDNDIAYFFDDLDSEELG